MWLITCDRQLLIKTEWRNVPLVLRDFNRSNKQELSENIAISLHSRPHLHQSMLSILSCVKLISSLQLFPSSDIDQNSRISSVSGQGERRKSFKFFYYYFQDFRENKKTNSILAYFRYKRFPRNTLTRFHIKWFQRVYFSSSISEELLVSEIFFHITAY